MLITIVVLAVTHVVVGVAGFVYGTKRGKQVVDGVKDAATKTVSEATTKVNDKVKEDKVKA